MKSLGQLVKQLREQEGWPQRKLAYELDVDVSVLSKIENDNRFPKKRVSEILKTVSRLFGVSEKDLRECYFSDEIASILVYEEDISSILKVSEAKVKYARANNIKQSEIQFKDASN
ncbi:MAG: helix-turn-helix transcriptional regulator [Bacteroidota bacterium]